MAPMSPRAAGSARLAAALLAWLALAAPVSALPALDIELEKRIDKDAVFYDLRVTPAEPVDPERTRAVAHLSDSTGFNSMHELDWEDGAWRMTYRPERVARYRLEVHVQGRGEDGQQRTQQLTPQLFRYPAEGDPFDGPGDEELRRLEAELAELRGELPTTFALPDPPPVRTLSPEHQAELDRGLNWLLYLGLGFLNLLLFAAIYFVYRLLSREAPLEQLADEVDDEEPAQGQGESLAMADLSDQGARQPDPEEEKVAGAAQPAVDVAGEEIAPEPPPAEPDKPEESGEKAADLEDSDEPLFPLDESFDDETLDDQADWDEEPDPPEDKDKP